MSKKHQKDQDVVEAPELFLLNRRYCFVCYGIWIEIKKLIEFKNCFTLQNSNCVNEIGKKKKVEKFSEMEAWRKKFNSLRYA